LHLAGFRDRDGGWGRRPGADGIVTGYWLELSGEPTLI